MKYGAVHRLYLQRPPALTADHAAIGAWVRVLVYAISDGVESERLAGARSWDDREWLARARITAAGVDRAVVAGLLVWDGNDLVVQGLDAAATRRLPGNGAPHAYGPGWKAARAAALRRDDSECVRCGSEDDLNVHHVVPFVSFAVAEDAHRLGNLETLCRACHLDEHRKRRAAP